MNVDHLTQIQQAKEAVEKMKSAKARAEADYDHYKQRQEELETQAKELGVEPDQLPAKIKELGSRIEENMNQIWSMIPEQFRS